MNEPITEYRRDGWPVCPRCGEDEIMSWLDSGYVFEYIEKHGCNPPREEYLSARLTCLYCGWERAAQRIETAIKRPAAGDGRTE